MLTTVERNVAAPAEQRADSWARFGRALLRHRWALATTIALVTIFVANGVPLDAMALLIFAVTIMGIDSLTTKGLAETGRVFKDWAPLFAVLVFYDLTHGVAESMGMPLQVEALINADKAMFLGEVPTVWLQEHMLHTEIQWWEVFLTLVYCSHFFFSPGLMLWLYSKDRSRWADFARRFLTLNAFGLATYILVPAAPPWWASEHGEIGEVGRVLGRGWSVIGLETAGGIMTTGQGRVNEVAAMPSLHAGYSMLITLVLLRTARRSVTKWLLIAYPLAMGFTLVYGGEHYVIDLIFGWLYAWGVMVLWDRIDAWRAAKAQQSSPEKAAVPA